VGKGGAELCNAARVLVFFMVMHFFTVYRLIFNFDSGLLSWPPFPSLTIPLCVPYTKPISLFPPKHTLSLCLFLFNILLSEPLHLVGNGLQLTGVVIKLCLFSFIARFNMIAFIGKVYLSKLDQLYQRRWVLNIMWGL